jgi:hypothetical protein
LISLMMIRESCMCTGIALFPSPPVEKGDRRIRCFESHDVVL